MTQEDRRIEVGVQTLYDAASQGLESLVDIVAVHGIAADPDRTWTSRDVNWLSAKHMLPFEAPNTRVLRFAYESQWLGRVTIRQRLPLVADQLLSSVQTARKSCQQRPLIFVAHRFGGLVVEKAIALSKLHVEDYPNLFRSIAGVILLGTPHRGSDSQSLASLLSNISSFIGCAEAKSLLDALEKGGDTLIDTVHDFTRTANLASIPVFCFFEQLQSDVAKVVRPSFMPWLHYKDTVVDEISGCIDGFPKRGLNCDHFNLQRYSHAEDGNYRFVVNELLKLVDAAPSKISVRFRTAASSISIPRQHEQRDQACIRAVYITSPEDDLQKIVQTRDRLVEGTCSWLFVHHEYLDWLNADSDFLWIHGQPGKGKTMLAVAMVQELQQRIELEGPGSGSTLAYFFCDSEDDRRNSGVAILRGLIYQLLCQRPDLCSSLRVEYDRQGEQLFHSSIALQSLWRILRSLLEFPNFHEVYLVIDGLDECSTEATQAVLTLLEPLLEPSSVDSGGRRKSATESRCRVKWLLTSRNEDLIRQHLSAVPDISLERNSSEVSSAVTKFVNAKVEQLTRHKHYNAELQSLIQNILLEKSGGTFLWVAVVCRELMKPKISRLNTEDYLSRMPAGITAMYDRIMDQLISGEDENLVAFALQILRAMTVALRPLTLLELGVAAGLPPKHRADCSMVEEYVHACGSFVEIRGDVTHFVHLSARDYLVKTAVLMSPTSYSGHRMVAEHCFAYVDRSVSTKPASEPALAYPALFWIDHARTVPDQSITVINAASVLFRNESQKERQAWLRLYWRSRHPTAEQRPDLGPLHLAAYAGLHFLVAELLQIEAAQSLDARDSLGNTSLIWAARRGCTNAVKVLLKAEAKVDMKNNEGATALALAATNGHAEIVTELLSYHAQTKLTDKSGWNPLHRAAHHGHIRAVEILLDGNADLEALDPGRWSALQRACSSGQLEVVTLLLDRKAQLEVRDREGMTPVLQACWNGHLDVLRILLERGAELEAKDSDGWDALNHSSWNGRSTIVKELLMRGANVNAVNKDRNTSLFQASWTGHATIIATLLSYGADVNARCDKGETALQQSAYNGHLEATHVLLDAGADVDVRSDNQTTALHQAASNRQDAVVRLLLKYGADHTLEDDDGATAYMLAKENFYSSTAQILRDSGARTPESKLGAFKQAAAEVIPFDSALAKATGLAPDTVTIEPHGYGCSASSWKLSGTSDGEDKVFFVKTGPQASMFKGEYESLTELGAIEPAFCPRPLAHGKFEASDDCFIVTEFIDVNHPDTSNPPAKSSFAQKLARIHNAPTPIPRGHNQPRYGYHVPTHAGPPAQDNTWTASWPKFYANNRLLHLSKLIDQKWPGETDLMVSVEQIATVVVHKLLGNGHLGGRRGIKPSLVHGDLWSGNKARGVIEGRGCGEWAFDSPCAYAHSEYELGVMRMFGGFSTGFFSEYHKLVPKTEPVDEYDDRMELYQLYHWLTNYYAHGGGYRDDAMDCMQKLWRKWGLQDADSNHPLNISTTKRKRNLNSAPDSPISPVRAEMEPSLASRIRHT